MRALVIAMPICIIVAGAVAVSLSTALGVVMILTGTLLAWCAPVITGIIKS